jgi:predicted transcriptional regulator
MRTTIRLDDDLLVEIKQLAARTDRTLTSVIEDALREMLARQKGTKDRLPVKLTTVSGGGLQPGVDLDDSAALLSLMEEFSDSA